MNYWKLKHTVGSTAAARGGVYATANARSLGGTACGYWSGKQVTSPRVLRRIRSSFHSQGAGHTVDSQSRPRATFTAPPSTITIERTWTIYTFYR